MADYQQFKKQAFDHPVVWGEGKPGRPMILGHAPLSADEKRPFTEGDNLYLRSVLNRMGVPDSYLYFNYLFKEPYSVERRLELKEHVVVTRRELYYWCQPTTLIVMGANTFAGLYHLPEVDIEKLRRIRFLDDSNVNLSVFVTYSPADVAAAYERSDWSTVHNFQEDLSGIFEGNRHLFVRTQKLKAVQDA